MTEDSLILPGVAPRPACAAAVPLVERSHQGAASLEALTAAVAACSRCGLRSGATRTVPGEGNPHARLMLVGEGPGQQEDLSGRPFVGAAGQLLERMLGAINLTRQEVFIGNVVKCRPPGNRTPTDDEAVACLPYVLAQIELVDPKVILLLGATATRALAGRDLRITKARGQWLERGGRLYLPTFHPAALLRDPRKKREAWIDLQLVRDELSRTG